MKKLLFTLLFTLAITVSSFGSAPTVAPSKSTMTRKQFTTAIDSARPKSAALAAFMAADTGCGCESVYQWEYDYQYAICMDSTGGVGPVALCDLIANQWAQDAWINCVLGY